MRTNFDFSPLYRSAPSFDRLFNLIDDMSQPSADVGPSYDVVRIDDDTVRLTLAVPGFSRDELEVTAQPNLLMIAGRKIDDDGSDYMRRGIARAPFTRRFALADHVEVANADLKDGLLTLELKRELPEEMKPRRIAIGATDGQEQPEQRQIEGKAA